MTTYKNTLADQYDAIDVVFVIANRSPHAEYYTEAAPGELAAALADGSVYEAYKNTFVKA